MLLIWYTPPRAGAQRNIARHLMQRVKESNYVRDDEEALLLAWWYLITGEINNGTN
jgi:hypothetical protein